MLRPTLLPSIDEVTVKPLGQFQAGSLVFLSLDPDHADPNAREDDLPHGAARAVVCTVEVNGAAHTGAYLTAPIVGAKIGRFLYAGAYPELFAQLVAGIESSPRTCFIPGRGERVPDAGLKPQGRSTMAFTDAGPQLLVQTEGGLEGLLDPVRWHITTTSPAWGAVAYETRRWEARWLLKEGAEVGISITGR